MEIFRFLKRLYGVSAGWYCICFPNFYGYSLTFISVIIFNFNKVFVASYIRIYLNRAGIFSICEAFLCSCWLKFERIQH